MHINSLAAYKKLIASGEQLNRHGEIIRTMLDKEQRTDRQILNKLGYPDMNNVRPRITELIKAGLLSETGTQIDEVTGVQVRITQLKGR